MAAVLSTAKAVVAACTVKATEVWATKALMLLLLVLVRLITCASVMLMLSGSTCREQAATQALLNQHVAYTQSCTGASHGWQCNQSNMQADVKWLAGLWSSHLKVRKGIHNVKDTSCCAVLTNQLQIRAESLCCGIANGSILVAGACQLQCESLQDNEATRAVRVQARQACKTRRDACRSTLLSQQSV